MDEGDGGEAEVAFFSGHGGGDLQETLTAHEVGLKARTKGVAPPGDAGDMEAGSAQQRIVENGAKRGSGGELSGNSAAHDGKDVGHRKAIFREEPIGGSPVVELRSGSIQETGDGVASEAKQGTQREDLRAVGDAALAEGGTALVPELVEEGEDTGSVFLKAGGGASRRRSARRALS
jgi:hypothetical protein